jgi:hypothetical protein
MYFFGFWNLGFGIFTLRFWHKSYSFEAQYH